MEIYLVGGAVRDQLLGLKVKEQDFVVVGATPEQMLNDGFTQVGKDFPVFLHPESHEEYALARTERKVGQGYTGFECFAEPSVTLEEDLLRRDLTINAIAQKDNKELVDPYGGVKDIEKRVLRHVSPAFVEDPLRVIRVARFAARFKHLEFEIAEGTRSLMKDIVSQGEIEKLTPERVWQEMRKAFLTQNPEVFFEVLAQCGAFERLFHFEVEPFHMLKGALQRSQKAADLSEPEIIDLRYALWTFDFLLDVSQSSQANVERNLDKLEQALKTIPIPKSTAKLSQLLLRSFQCFQQDKIAIEDVLNLYNQSDAWRNKERFALLALALELALPSAEARIKKVFEPVQEISQIDVQEALEKGLKGPEIGAYVEGQRKAKLASIWNAESV